MLPFRLPRPTSAFPLPPSAFPAVRLLDRYILRNFLLPFTYCVVGFIAVWLVYALSNNANSFINGGVNLVSVFVFYGGQVPSISLLILPIALLLALLYCLGRMSQSNELIAMLSAGVSLGRILWPVFFLGMLVTALSTYLSYAPAPEADARRDLAEAQLQNDNGKIEKKLFTLGYIFPNRGDRRLWYIEKMPADEHKPLEGVVIIQQDAQHDITAKLYAKTATYDRHTHQWTFSGCRTVQFNPDGLATSYPDTHVVTGWSETPWRIASQLLKADKLSVPELHQYLRLNGDFTPTQLAPFRTYLFGRWALPWRCLVVVLLAAPLGVVYQRRSVIAGVAAAILMFLFILFFDSMFVSLGQGSRLGPALAAWATNVAFGIIGLVLLRQKTLNMDRLPTTPATLRQFVFGT